MSDADKLIEEGMARGWQPNMSCIGVVLTRGTDMLTPEELRGWLDAHPMPTIGINLKA